MRVHELTLLATITLRNTSNGDSGSCYIKRLLYSESLTKKLMCCGCQWHSFMLCIAGHTVSKDLNPIFLNLAINGVGIVGTNWLFQRDLKNRRRDRASVEREEALARLQVSHMSLTQRLHL